MQPLNALRHLARFDPSCTRSLILLLTLLLVECGGHTSSTNLPPNWGVYIAYDYLKVNGSSVHLGGTSFSDLPTSENCPIGQDSGMTIKWNNQSSGTSGDGILYFTTSSGGPWFPSQCELWWSAVVPLIPGKNVIVISVIGKTHTGSASIEEQGSLAVLTALPWGYLNAAPVNSTVSATFNGQIDPQTITSSSFILSSPYGTQTGRLAVIGSSVTFTPDNYLYGNTTYTATITTAVKDINGNVLAVKDINGNVLDGYTWNFITGSGADTTLPTVISTFPTNNATGVAVNTAITATFSEPMLASTANTATFTLNNGVTGTVTYSFNTATFTPTSSLANSTIYTATITTGVRDASANAMAAAYTWKFTTKFTTPDTTAPTTPDTTAPTVSSTSPANGITAVAVNTTIAVMFNEPMDASTVSSATFTLNNGVTGTVTSIGNGATLTPTSNLATLTTYTATITTGVKDIAGNAMAADYTWTFTTGTEGAYFKMPDTNQTLCYDASGTVISCAGTGQDGDYIINPPSYTDNGDGTITDNVSGLVWQKQDDSIERTWDNAITYCSNLTLAGQAGWRVPTRIELISIVDYGVSYPSINATYFPNTIYYTNHFYGGTTSYYWSSTKYLGDTLTADGWRLYFGTGYSDPGSVGYLNYVRCVRGGQ